MTPREWRTANKLTIKKVSQEIGYASSTISEAESGAKTASGGIMLAYFKLSNGAVGLEDWAKIAPQSSTRTDAAPPV